MCDLRLGSVPMDFGSKCNVSDCYAKNAVVLVVQDIKRISVNMLRQENLDLVG